MEPVANSSKKYEKNFPNMFHFYNKGVLTFKYNKLKIRYFNQLIIEFGI